LSEALCSRLIGCVHLEPLEPQEKLPKSGSNWHAVEIGDAIQALQSDFNGLSHEEIEARLREFGYNEMRKRKRASPLQIFLSQFRNVFTIILLIAIVISVFLGWYESQALHEPRTLIETYIDSIVIGSIVILNAVVGFFQEYRSEKAIEAM